MLLEHRRGSADYSLEVHVLRHNWFLKSRTPVVPGQDVIPVVGCCHGCSLCQRDLLSWIVGAAWLFILQTTRELSESVSVGRSRNKVLVRRDGDDLFGFSSLGPS